VSYADESHTSPTDTNDTSEFFGGTIPSASFETEGDTVRGIVIAKELRMSTKDDGKGNIIIDRWDDGRPKKIAVLTLRTRDDQELNLFVRGYMQPAFIETLKFLDLKDVQIGADIRVTWSSTDAPKRKGFNGARHYAVDYAPPGERLVDLLSEQERQADEPPF
jgi:hypothetical protein